MVLRENYGYEEDESTLKIYMSREDLANLSNMTTANAIRTLSTFVDERLITVDGRRIRIINESQLRKSVNSVNTVWNNSPYFTSISGNRQIIDNKYFLGNFFLSGRVAFNFSIISTGGFTATIASAVPHFSSGIPTR